MNYLNPEDLKRELVRLTDVAVERVNARARVEVETIQQATREALAQALELIPQLPGGMVELLRDALHLSVHPLSASSSRYDNVRGDLRVDVSHNLGGHVPSFTLNVNDIPAPARLVVIVLPPTAAQKVKP